MKFRKKPVVDLAAIHDLLAERLPKPDPEAYERAAAEYQSLRETQERASEQQAEALTLAQQFMEAIRGEPRPCGCRRNVEPLNPGEAWVEGHDADPRPESCCGTCPPLARGGYDCTCDARCDAKPKWADLYGIDPTYGDPEPESVTVTLPERILGRPWTVMELRMLAEWADNAGSGEAGAVLGHVADALDVADTPPAPPGAHDSDDQPQEAPEDGEGIERPTAANLGRIGWLRPSISEPWFLVHEAPNGWSEDSTSDALWFADEQPDAVFTPLTPADCGWTVLGEGQVAVKREDLPGSCRCGTPGCGTSPRNGPRP